MSNRIYLGVFDRFGIRGDWAHSKSESLRYRDIDYWIEKAKLLDEAGFDFVFLADVLGYGTDEDGRISRSGVAGGGSVPRMDALAVIPVMAAVTDRLGFISTMTTGLEHPAKFARTLTSFDHITGGRLAWNMVTGAAQDSVAQLYGHGSTIPHDERYERASEFLEVAMKYWEGCWEDDAVLEDRVNRVFADRDKLHRIEHNGRFYESSGYLTGDPSPQRTPALVQAGNSEAGMDFAARYAEAVFVQGHIPNSIHAIQERAVAFGRHPGDIKFFSDIRVFTGASAEEAAEDLSGWTSRRTPEQTAAGFRTLTGIDLLKLDPKLPLTQLPPEKLRVETGQSSVDRCIALPGEPEITVEEILRTYMAPSGSTITGTGEEVADRIIEYVDENNLDGVMIDLVYDLHTCRTFIENVLPALEARGRRVEPQGTTFRSRLMGYGDRLPDRHVAGAFRPKSEASASPIA
ncbi:NtaA/DmoA family FMN-dependent monooxygenase [Microbacterium sp. 18062]|uniref:NtaA/DmoA family FMN-dependent monooxygenase n=1 Tax=Microbacterium sp. 18062 TaxID=2681410 RepID=UPI001357A9B9|nr:NtaA/DmoA family FMN-dependent monooxygenase [Microbacterium sp. 18062]